MNENLIKIISTETLSVDFFKGERKIALFSDGDYSELKMITGEYGVKKYSLNDEIARTDSSLIVGFGEGNILEKAKNVALKEGKNLLLIPTTPSIYDFLPYRICENLSVESELNGHSVLLVADILNNQPREKIAWILGSISAVLISLLDYAFNCFLREEEGKAQMLLEKISQTTAYCSKFSCPTPTVGFELSTLLGEISAYLPSDSISIPLLGAYVFSLYKKEKMSYNDCIFACSFAIFSLIDSFKVQPELFIPPKRYEVRNELKKLFPEFNEFVSLEPEEYVLRNFILKDRLSELKCAVKQFPLLAKAYLRLCGNSGFSLRKRFTAEELLRVLPLVAESRPQMSLLTHIYSTGIMQ